MSNCCISLKSMTGPDPLALLPIGGAMMAAVVLEVEEEDVVDEPLCCTPLVK